MWVYGDEGEAEALHVRITDIYDHERIVALECDGGNVAQHVRMLMRWGDVTASWEEQRPTMPRLAKRMSKRRRPPPRSDST